MFRPSATRRSTTARRTRPASSSSGNRRRAPRQRRIRPLQLWTKEADSSTRRIARSTPLLQAVLRGRPEGAPGGEFLVQLHQFRQRRAARRRQFARRPVHPVESQRPARPVPGRGLPVDLLQRRLHADYAGRQFSKDRSLTSVEKDFVRQRRHGSDTNTDSYYIRFELNHKPSDRFQQRLSGSKTLEVGSSRTTTTSIMWSTRSTGRTSARRKSAPRSSTSTTRPPASSPSRPTAWRRARNSSVSHKFHHAWARLSLYLEGLQLRRI